MAIGEGTRSGNEGPQDQLGVMFAKRKAEGTETEGMLAPDGGARIACKSYDDKCDEWCGRPGYGECPHSDRNRTTITVQHAKELIGLVRWLKSVIEIECLPLALQSGGGISIEDCDELLEDLVQ